MGKTKVQGDNKEVVSKRLPNMSKNPVSTVVLVKLIAIFDYHMIWSNGAGGKNCEQSLHRTHIW